MDLKKFSAINLQRCTSPEGFNHPLSGWSLAEWTNALAGEVGEACNVAKKILRHRDGLAGNVKPEDLDEAGLRDRLASELADVIGYADLVMQALGRDTSEVLAANFNAKSRALGCPILFLEGKETP